MLTKVCCSNSGQRHELGDFLQPHGQGWKYLRKSACEHFKLRALRNQSRENYEKREDGRNFSVQFKMGRFCRNSLKVSKEIKPISRTL